LTDQHLTSASAVLQLKQPAGSVRATPLYINDNINIIPTPKMLSGPLQLPATGRRAASAPKNFAQGVPNFNQQSKTTLQAHTMHVFSEL
jgi:hypothetical protein